MSRISNHIWNIVDDVLSLVTGDEATRYVAQIVIWATVILLSHNLIESYALLIVTDFILLYSGPWWLANLVTKSYIKSREKYPPFLDHTFTFEITIYVMSLLMMIGIPYLYGGLLIQITRLKPFQFCYWATLNVWEIIFNFAYPNQKAINSFLKSMVISENALAMKLLLGFGVIAPIMAFSLYPGLKEKREKDRELERSERLKREREFEQQERERMRPQYERIERAQENVRLREEFRRRQEADRAEALTKSNAKAERLKRERKSHLEQIEIEKKRKIDARIREVKGKDPWDSDFI